MPEGTFNVAKSKNNLPKNRYTDVLCYDHSRVILSEVDNDKDSDYIHANFVDGYKQKNAFINTQGIMYITSLHIGQISFVLFFKQVLFLKRPRTFGE